MTDRLKGLIVVLDKDYRDDDAQAIIDAILMIKGVLTVKAHVLNADDYMLRARIQMELEEKIYAVIKEARRL